MAAPIAAPFQPPATAPTPAPTPAPPAAPTAVRAPGVAHAARIAMTGTEVRNFRMVTSFTMVRWLGSTASSTTGHTAGISTLEADERSLACLGQYPRCPGEFGRYAGPIRMRKPRARPRTNPNPMVAVPSG